MAKRRAAGIVVYRWGAGDTPEFLLMRHAGCRGWWTPPKGHLDGDETFEEAAWRETEEESGLRRADLDQAEGFRHEIRYDVTTKKGKRKRKVVVYFLAELRGGGVRLSHEHSDFAWDPIEAACARTGFASLNEVLRAADRAARIRRNSA